MVGISGGQNMSDSTRELLETLQKVFLRCWIIGVVLQFVTIGAVLGMSEVIYAWHDALSGLSAHDSDVLVAAYMANLKLIVALLFFTPWLSIWLVLRAERADS
jgi:Family of unknown function (DUF6868)